MPDIAPAYQPGAPVLISHRPMDAGAATLHLGAASGTLCGLPAHACSGGVSTADLVLLELMVSSAVPCSACQEIVRSARPVTSRSA
jgi:hypothetical protein